MTERIIRTGDLALASESFGDAANPPVLLIMGAMGSMLWWPDAFCARLAGRGRHVVRYDNRDTGRSTQYPPGEPGYTFEDMAGDLFRVMDGHGLAAAHVAGMSLGGLIGQAAALAQPSRVLSLTAISSSPLGWDGPVLPPFSAAVSAHMSAGEHVDWRDRDQVIAYMVEDSRLLAGTAQPFDAGAARAFVTRDYDRAGGYLSATNHGFLKTDGGGQGRLRGMRMPVMVIHGTADPIYPHAHGEALAGAVAGSALVLLEGGGHELAPVHWDTIVDAIVSHTGG